MTDDQMIRSVATTIGTFSLVIGYERIKQAATRWGGVMGFWRKVGYICGKALRGMIAHG